MSPEDALALVLGIEAAQSSAVALARVAQGLPPTRRRTVIAGALQAVRRIGDSCSRVSVLLRIAQLLPTEEGVGISQKALTIARSIDAADAARLSPHPSSLSRIRVNSLLEVAGQLAGKPQRDVLDEALVAASAINDASVRALALCDVAQLLSPQEALRIIRSLDDDHAMLVVRMLPPDEALLVIRSIGNAVSRVQALLEVAERLPADHRSRVTSEAVNAARDIDDVEARAKVLVGIAQRVPAEQALIVARGIGNARHQIEALAEAAGRLPEIDRKNVLDEAVGAASRIADSIERIEALASLAKHLPTEKLVGLTDSPMAAGTTTGVLSSLAFRDAASLPDRFVRRFAIKSLPLNHDVERAVRLAQLRAAEALAHHIATTLMPSDGGVAGRVRLINLNHFLERVRNWRRSASDELSVRGSELPDDEELGLLVSDVRALINPTEDPNGASDFKDVWAKSGELILAELNEAKVSNRPREFDDVLVGKGSFNGLTSPNAVSAFFAELLKTEPGLYQSFSVDLLGGLANNLLASNAELRSDLATIQQSLGPIGQALATIDRRVEELAVSDATL
jgi:hypothetical protein